MSQMSQSDWEKLFEEKIRGVATSDDPAHDLIHFRRVVATAKKLAIAEKANINVVVAGAWLHDLVIIPKNDPRRSKASRMSADEALVFLDQIKYPKEHHANIAHAIEAHSFSAGITPTTLEAKIVQDADRLDGLGAIGVARCFATAGLMKRSFYSDNDPLCEERAPNDQLYTIDHFYQKLFKTAETLQTSAGRIEGSRRVQSMKSYLGDLKKDILGL